MFSFFSKPKSYLGVDLGAGGIKVVEVQEVKKRPMLFTYGFTSEFQDIHRLSAGNEQEPEDFHLEQTEGIRPVKKNLPQVGISEQKIDKYANALKEVCRQAKTRSKNASVSLPVSAVFHSIVTLPKVDEKDLSSILKAEVKKLLPYPIDDMVLDYQILEKLSDDRHKKVMVNAVPKSIVEFYTKVFQRAGLILDSLEPESTALERALVGRDQAVTMLIDMGAERTNLFIIDQTIPITNHTIESGGNKINKILAASLGIEEKMVERMKRDLFDNSFKAANGQKISRENFIKMLDPIIDPIVKQIEYSFDLYLHQGGNEEKRPEKIVLTGGAAMMPYLAEHLSDTFKIKCYLGDPWARIVYQEKLKPVLNEIGPRMSVAIGLALRKLS